MKTSVTSLKKHSLKKGVPKNKIYAVNAKKLDIMYQEIV